MCVYNKQNNRYNGKVRPVQAIKDEPAHTLANLLTMVTPTRHVVLSTTIQTRRPIENDVRKWLS